MLVEPKPNTPNRDRTQDLMKIINSLLTVESDY